MNPKKVLSILLLVAMSYSIVHDYAFLFHDDHHSVQEYISQLETPATDSVGADLHDTHYEYHMSYIFESKLVFFSDMEKAGAIFRHNEIVHSRNSFNFLKPPIA